MDNPGRERGKIASLMSETSDHSVVYGQELQAEQIMIQKENSSAPITSEEVVEDLKPPDTHESTESITPIEGLSCLLSYLFAAILEDVMVQMWCLDRCNNEMKIVKINSEMDHHLGLKYGISRPDGPEDVLAGIDPHKLNCNIYKIVKLDNDRKYLNEIIRNVYIELANSLNFTALRRYIKESEDRENYRKILEDEEYKNRLHRKDISRQVRQQRNHIKSVIYDTEVTTDKLKTQVEDSVLFSEVRSRYIHNWQRARTEQHSQVIYDVEDNPISKINYYKRRSEQENRVHSEVDLLVTIAINETLHTIEEWMDKYEKDMEAIDLKIHMKKNDYQNMRDRRLKLEETLAIHEVQMKNWINFKDEREKARVYHDLMMKSAIIVQAWWRGLLVRLQLGPYKVKKPKKQKKK